MAAGSALTALAKAPALDTIHRPLTRHRPQGAFMNTRPEPKNIPSRSAVSAVMGRSPFTNSLILLGETSMSAASWRALMPMGFLKSSSRISPG
jgi:hypothetical protein